MLAAMKIIKSGRVKMYAAIGLAVAGCAAVVAVSLVGGQPRVGYPGASMTAVEVDGGTGTPIVER